MVAAACSEVDRRRGEPLGDSPLWTEPPVVGGKGVSLLDNDILDRTGRDGGDEGREFRSGAMSLMVLSS